jgi:hypothetical protein
MKRRYRFWTAKEKAVVKEHYGPFSREWWPVRKIAQSLRLSVEDVQAAAKRYGLCHAHRPGPLSAAQLKKAERLYERGLDDAAIAKRLPCARETVMRWRHRTGRPRPMGRPKKSRA